MMPLKTVAYYSHVKCDNELQCLLDIAIQATRNNQKNDITGLLVYEGTHFLQIIEGPVAAVDKTFEVIRSDKRHKNVTVLLDTETDERQYTDWGLEAFFLDNPGIVNDETLKAAAKIYKRNCMIKKTRKFFTWLREAVDFLDTFKIQHGV